jgi:periplasmic protein TonB
VSILSDVFTAEEIARASGVPQEAVDALIASGDLQPQRGTPFFSGADAVRSGRQAREIARRLAEDRCRIEPDLFSVAAYLPAGLGQRRAMPTFAAWCGQAALVVLMVWFASRSGETAASNTTPPTRLVFLALPGPGGGGGGGGLKNPLPAPRLERIAHRSAVSVAKTSAEHVLLTARRVETPPPVRPAPRPDPEPRAQEPIPSHVLVAPVAASGRDRQREGEIAAVDRRDESLGAGSDGGAGAGRGTGNGPGLGSGIGPGTGGGTGGGPFRAGSGIEPPRLLREVKAIYTEDARRRGITGDVDLEIVVKRDGAVDDVRVLRGLDAGLDQRAIAAVREWRFAPARRQGEAVDVIVQVSVEFTLR